VAADAGTVVDVSYLVDLHRRSMLLGRLVAGHTGYRTAHIRQVHY
jgi:hypothetical protein